MPKTKIIVFVSYTTLYIVKRCVDNDSIRVYTRNAQDAFML